MRTLNRIRRSVSGSIFAALCFAAPSANATIQVISANVAQDGAPSVNYPSPGN